MAVWTNIYGDKGVCYEGCVLHTYECNGYDDSDWYAVVWDEEKGKVIEVEYDTTRCGGGGWAKIDATEEVLHKVYRFYKELDRTMFDTRTNISNAKKVRVGDEVRVIRGRKIPKNTVGKVFWTGVRTNYYTYRDEERVGIEFDGKREFLPLDYVEVIDWESRLAHGKERKRAIINFSVNSMPIQYRGCFERKWVL